MYCRVNIARTILDFFFPSFLKDKRLLFVMFHIHHDLLNFQFNFFSPPPPPLSFSICMLKYLFVQVCCICLAKYADNDELRELACAHFFHKECVDKWLKINALCPLCKAEVPNSSSGPLGLNFGRRHIDRRVGNDIESQS